MTVDNNDTTIGTPDVAGGEGASEAPPSVDAPQREVEALRAERDDLRDRLLRAQAECANISKRLTLQHAASLKTAGLQLARSMLCVLDNLDRTVEAIPGHDAEDALVVGINLVRQEFIKALKEHGVVPIEAVGQPFDPTCHEALMRDSQSDAAPGTVTQELQRGYCMHDRVVRPAKVAVASAKADAEPADVKSVDSNDSGEGVDHADV